MSQSPQFRKLSIPDPLKASLAKMGFETLTDIQSATINNSLVGRDILGSSQTGTGKTAAYAVPVLAHLYRNPGKQALIVVPTRELGTQIHNVLRQMTKGMHMEGSLILGGKSFSRQSTEVNGDADYIIATPGRLNDHLGKKSFTLNRVAFLVLDEVDLMMDLGFSEQINAIVEHLPKERQTMFFSATLPAPVVAIAEKLLNKPFRTTVGDTNRPVSSVKHINIKVMSDKKQEQLLKEVSDRTGSILVFARNKEGTEHLAKVLERHSHSVDFVHGERTPRQRRTAIELFKSGARRILVATDIAARGLDIEGIEAVINYHLPQSREDYIHRAGRTGRHGNTGLSINFITPRDKDAMRKISKVIGITDRDFYKGVPDNNGTMKTLPGQIDAVKPPVARPARPERPKPFVAKPAKPKPKPFTARPKGADSSGRMRGKK